MDKVTLFQALTLALAAVGAVLGVINTLHGLDKSRVKLKVTPQHAISVGGADSRIEFCIEVINLSAFAVTVRDVGVLYHGTDALGSIASPPFLIDGGPWPRRLEPRSAVTLYSPRPQSWNGERVKCAYAQTECGHMKTGNSP